MPRPVSRTRIISAGAGAAVTVAALAFALNPPSEVDPLGTLGRASAMAPPAVPEAAAAPPVAFGVEGVDLSAVGYRGPDPTAVTLGSLSKPFSALPTERAADIRDRIARATPHLHGLHQAKNLLKKSLPRHDDHVRAAKEAVARAQSAREASTAELAAVRARVEEPRADAPDEGGPDERPGADVDPAPPGVDAGVPGRARPDLVGGPAAGDGQSRPAGGDADPGDRRADAAQGQGDRKAADNGADPAAPGAAGAGKHDGKHDGKTPKDGKPGAGKGAAGDGPAGKSEAGGQQKGAGTPKASRASTTDNGSVKVAAASTSAPSGVQLASAPRDDDAPAQVDPAGGGEAPRGDAPEPGAAPAPPADPAIPAAPVIPTEPQVNPAAEVGKLVVLAKAEATAMKAEAAHADAVADLEARRQRREAYRAATAAAEHEVWRLDAHIRWLQHELWLAQRQMPSAGNWLVIEERKDAETPIVEVRGFRVHKSLEHSVRQLVDSAAAAGIDLKGKAYRPVSRQIELRRQNCGTSDYDIFHKPSSQCSPPTAKPGRSLHEMGLALDFRNGPNGITSRRDPAFQWLARHAPSYGLYNLPAEPWHWSVTGQ